MIFRGSGVALVTPMLEDGTINYETLKDLIEYHINSGSDAIIVAGTTGESSTLKEKEYNELINKAVEYAQKKIKIIAGAGSNSTAKAILKSKQAKIAGVDGILIVTPYYNKTSQEGLIKHYFSIAESVEIPIILYNVPSRTGLTIKPETYLKLSSHPNIVATKEASGNISEIAKIKCLCKDKLDIYSGNDDQILPILALGGVGVISVAANIIPKEIHEICQLFFEGKVKESRELQLRYLPLINEMFSDINPIPIKKMMTLMKIEVGKCRLPLIDLGEEALDQLKETLRFYKLIG